MACTYPAMPTLWIRFYGRHIYAVNAPRMGTSAIFQRERGVFCEQRGNLRSQSAPYRSARRGFRVRPYGLRGRKTCGRKFGSGLRHGRMRLAPQARTCLHISFYPAGKNWGRTPCLETHGRLLEEYRIRTPPTPSIGGADKRMQASHASAVPELNHHQAPACGS